MALLKITTQAGALAAVDLHALTGADSARLPWLMRILLENVARNQPPEETRRVTAAIGNWLVKGSSEAEIAFHPLRVLMHDTTCVPALVDIAAMRDVIAEHGGDPHMLNPVLPVDVSTDHSVAVDRYRRADALEHNMRREMERNSERYRLMKWATRSLSGVRVHPPGTGIMHTINLEQLATVIATEERDGLLWAVPDSLVGTDSHTPMVNGIGVLGWGVGGLEAESVFFGMPVMLRLPDIVGVRLTGAMPEGVLSTDLALTVTERLRTFGISGQFVEFFGPGVAGLSAGDRAVVANMAPEYGASSGYFPIDDRTLAYLRQTGRPEALIERVEAVSKQQGLWFDPAAEPRYSDVIDIDLSVTRTSLAGPRRPQDRLDASAASHALERAEKRPLRKPVPSRIPDGAVAIAAITSCTNTTDPRLTIAAGLVARKARQFGLVPPAWVKTSLAPGSPAATRYLERAGLLDDLKAVGFDIVGFGCTTCIGNSGPLQPEMEQAIKDGVVATAVLSGNRNFPGRVHPSLRNGFLASPPLVIVFALAGDANRDILLDPIGTAEDGQQVFLSDLWPTGAQIDAAMRSASESGDYGQAFAAAEANAVWQSLQAPGSARFPWDPHSTYIRRPPFATAEAPVRLGRFIAQPLLILGDDITTDHISPAGQILQNSIAGGYLAERGDDPDDLNVFAARRGNWEAMVRGLFDNGSVQNSLAPDGPAGSTLHVHSGEISPLWDVARRYREQDVPVVIVAGERYGTGSSRDWAAKGVQLLGVRAILAGSFERIHRSNLIGMGILPIVLPEGVTPRSLDIRAGDRIEIDSSVISVRGTVPVTILRRSGEQVRFSTKVAVETALEIATLGAGGMIPLILSRIIVPAAEPGAPHP